ncbi:MAG: substrate-binding domain-containing protein, partial [Ruminococcus sp.]|nr:substrate-binding domain-containing protein [Ruminococcus sp.]
MPDERYKIGLLVANIVDTFSNQLAVGAMEAAEELDADLFIFPGKYIGLEYLYALHDAKYEYQYNVLFDIAAKAGLDYLIVGIGTIAYACDEERKLEIMSSLGDVPKLSIAAKLPGYDYMIFDNRTCIEQAVEYLAAQGKKHIEILAGDLNNTDCKERCEAYRSTMAKCGLTIGEGYIKECDISEKCAPSVKELLDDVPELDAVVCVNDIVAKELYAELKRRDITIGSDIAVTGFDDLPFAAELEPSLASIKADATEMGRRSVYRAVNYLKGKKDDLSLLPTQFVPRQSSSSKGVLYHAPETIFNGTREDIHNNLSVYLSDKGIQASNDSTEVLLSKFDIMTAFLEDNFVNSETTEEILMEAITLSNKFFTIDFMAIDSLVKIYRMVDGAYNWVLKRCPEKNLIYVRRLYEYVYKRIANELVREYRRLQDNNTNRTHINNIFIRDTLMFDRTGANVYSSTLKRMCDIGGLTAYLYLLPEPVNHDVGGK